MGSVQVEVPNEGLMTKTGQFIAKRMGKAIADYNMISAGDRILVGVSGGKDSLTLVLLLQERKRWVPIDYEVIGAYVRTDYRCRGCVHAEVLKEFLGKSGIPLHVIDINILQNPDGTRNEINCFWCSWNRRKALFALADRVECNKVALGHHRDDIVETILLNMFYQGEISTMSPRVSLFGGRLEIIRPLAYVDERKTRKFAKEMQFPTNICKCPYGENSKRKQVKMIISRLQKDCPYVKYNIFNSLKRIKKGYLV